MGETQPARNKKRPLSAKKQSWFVFGILALIVTVVMTLALVLPDDREPGDGEPVTDWPAGEWATSSPQEQGMDPAVLAEMMAYIDKHDMEIHSIVVVRNGRIVLEEYGEGYSRAMTHRIYSVTKSVTSILVGIAIDQGLIESVDTPLAELLPEYTMANTDGRKGRITLKHLLTMTDGIDWHELNFPYEESSNTVNQMWSSDDVVQYVLDRPMAREPGEAWAYNSGASILLGGIVEAATDRDLVEYAREVLFDPLGIGHVNWVKAPGDHYYTDGGIFLKPQDMARLGYLMLNNGQWDGQQIVSADWVKRSTAAHTQTFDFHGYGYQWWVLPDGQGYEATGFNQQRIFISPEANLVVAITADIPNTAYPTVGILIHNFILPACTDLPEIGSKLYDAHGFEFEYPGRFFLQEGPIPGLDAVSDDAGLVMVTSVREPLELGIVAWISAEIAGDNERENLDGYLESLAGAGVELLPGDYGEGKRDGQRLVYRYSKFSFNELDLSAVSGAWICDNPDLNFAATYATIAELSSEALLESFQAFVDGVGCR